MTTPTTVLLADDFQMTRRGLRSVVEAMEGWEICGEASTGREAVEMAGRLRPSIVVMDMMMPELNGLEATHMIKKMAPETEVLVFTGFAEEALIHQMFEAGARSFLMKTESKENIEAALHSLAAHKPYFTSEVGEVLFAKFLHGEKNVSTDTQAVRLTPREREIVQLLAEGKSNKAVADILGVSVKTAETHRASIMKKLRLESFAALVRYAIRNNFVTA
ncbi:MAG: response regulator transcription factor [Chthoniobacteraceae bacterium]